MTTTVEVLVTRYEDELDVTTIVDGQTALVTTEEILSDPNTDNTNIADRIHTLRTSGGSPAFLHAAITNLEDMLDDDFDVTAHTPTHTPDPQHGTSIEVLTVSLIDGDTTVTVFIDGTPTNATTTIVDPGYGHTRADWDTRILDAASQTDWTPTYRATVLDTLTEHANSAYIS